MKTKITKHTPSPQPFAVGDRVRWKPGHGGPVAPGPLVVSAISFSEWSGEWYVELGTGDRWYARDLELIEKGTFATPKEKP